MEGCTPSDRYWKWLRNHVDKWFSLSWKKRKCINELHLINLLKAWSPKYTVLYSFLTFLYTSSMHLLKGKCLCLYSYISVVIFQPNSLSEFPQKNCIVFWWKIKLRYWLLNCYWFDYKSLLFQPFNAKFRWGRTIQIHSKLMYKNKIPWDIV